MDHETQSTYSVLTTVHAECCFSIINVISPSIIKYHFVGNRRFYGDIIHSFIPFNCLNWFYIHIYCSSQSCRPILCFTYGYSNFYIMLINLHVSLLCLHVLYICAIFTVLTSTGKGIQPYSHNNSQKFTLGTGGGLTWSKSGKNSQKAG